MNSDLKKVTMHLDESKMRGYWCLIWSPMPGTAWTMSPVQHYTALWHVLTFRSAGNVSKPGSTMWLIPWWNYSAKDTYKVGTVEEPDRDIAWVPNSLQCSSTIPQSCNNKYSEMKRNTVILCFCLRWDTCYCLDMTEKIEIREDSQENRLCMWIAELQSLTRLLITTF